MSDDSQVKQDKPVKMKTVAICTPVHPSHTFACSGPYTSSDLGKLLYKMACEKNGGHPGPNTVLTLTSRDELQYVRGLKDAGMLNARELYDLLASTRIVEVRFTEVPEDRN